MTAIMIIVLCCLGVMTVVMVAEIDECRKLYRKAENLADAVDKLQFDSKEYHTSISLLNSDLTALTDDLQTVGNAVHELKQVQSGLNQWAVKTEMWKQRMLTAYPIETRKEEEEGNGEQGNDNMDKMQ